MKEQFKIRYPINSLFPLTCTYLNSELVSTSKTYKSMSRPLNLAQKQNMEECSENFYRSI